MRFDDLFDFDALPWPFNPAGKRRDRQPKRPRRWRWLERGELKLAILALIRDRPMHGYEVMQVLEEESAGSYKASPGSIYPTLQLLEDLGYLQARDHDGKKVYSITDAGRAHLDANQDQVKHIFERVSEFSSRFFTRDMSALTRRLSRLARATFQGAVGWVEDAELFSDMKAVLDRAVKDMEAAWDAARERRRAAKTARNEAETNEAEANQADANQPGANQADANQPGAE